MASHLAIYVYIGTSPTPFVFISPFYRRHLLYTSSLTTSLSLGQGLSRQFYLLTSHTSHTKSASLVRNKTLNITFPPMAHLAEDGGRRRVADKIHQRRRQKQVCYLCQQADPSRVHLFNLTMGGRPNSLGQDRRYFKPSNGFRCSKLSFSCEAYIENAYQVIDRPWLRAVVAETIQEMDHDGECHCHLDDLVARWGHDTAPVGGEASTPAGPGVAETDPPSEETGAAPEVSEATSGSHDQQAEIPATESMDGVVLEPATLRVKVRRTVPRRRRRRERRVNVYEITATTTARQLAKAIQDRKGGNMVDQMLTYQNKCLWNGDCQSREAGVHRPLVEVRTAKHQNLRTIN